MAIDRSVKVDHQARIGGTHQHRVKIGGQFFADLGGADIDADMAVQFFGWQAQVEERGRHCVTGMVGDQNQGAGAIGLSISNGAGSAALSKAGMVVGISGRAVYLACSASAVKAFGGACAGTGDLTSAAKHAGGLGERGRNRFTRDVRGRFGGRRPGADIAAGARRCAGPPRGRMVVVGAGKAGGAMARAFENAWRAAHPDRPVQGLVITRHGTPARPR